MKEALRVLSKRAHRSISLEQLTADWDRFVADVEEGYSDSIYEYTNDLSVRDLLEEIVNAGSAIVQRELNKTLKPIDDRFLGATRSLHKAVSNQSSTKDLPYWWFRIPLKLGKEFEDDLRAEGVL